MRSTPLRGSAVVVYFLFAQLARFISLSRRPATLSWSVSAKDYYSEEEIYVSRYITYRMNRFTPDDEEERSLYEILLGQKMTSLHKLYSGQLYESVQKQEIQRCDWSWTQMPTVSLVQQLQEYSCASSPHWRDRPLAKSYPWSIETQERRGSCGLLIVVRLWFIFSLYLWLFPHLSIFFLKGLNKTKNSHFLLLQTVFMVKDGQMVEFWKTQKINWESCLRIH